MDGMCCMYVMYVMYVMCDVYKYVRMQVCIAN